MLSLSDLFVESDHAFRQGGISALEGAIEVLEANPDLDALTFLHDLKKAMEA